MSFTDADFFFRQNEDNRGWLQPVCIALVLHVVTLVLSGTLPAILKRRPILDEVVTVNLVSFPEQEQAPTQPPPAENQAPPERLVPEKAKVSVAPRQDIAPEKVAPVKPVSLSPIKRKKKVRDPAREAEELARKKREEERQRELARARQQEKLADEEAARARAALAEMIRQKGVESSSTSARRSTGRQQVQSLVLKQYLSALYDRVQQFWVLPEMRKWDAGLETIVVLTIRRDGSVVRQIIEKGSKDPFFDQFVLQTIQRATPMPRFPKLMPESTIEVGLRFRPGELLTM